MRVIHISGARSWGGNEQQLGDIVPGLNKIGVENLVFGVPNSLLHNYCIENDIEFIECKDNKLNKFVNYIYLKQVVKKYKPDIIHLHTSDSVTVFTLSDILFSLKVPAIFSKKGMGKSMSILSKYKYNYNNIKAIICVSNVVKQFMMDGVIKMKNKDKLCVIYDCVNTDRVDKFLKTDNIKDVYKIASSKKIIGSIANHVDAKDIPTLLFAIQHLVYNQKYTDFKLIQIGKFSSITPSLEEQVKALRIEEYVLFTDFVSNASGYLPQFDVFVVSSQREGGPSSVLEAFYSKLPVVSTRVGILPEVVIDSENGFLAAIKDYKSLAEKIKKLLENPTLQKQFAENCSILFNENFEVTKSAQKTVAIYRKVLKSCEFY